MDRRASDAALVFPGRGRLLSGHCRRGRSRLCVHRNPWSSERLQFLHEHRVCCFPGALSENAAMEVDDSDPRAAGDDERGSDSVVAALSADAPLWALLMEIPRFNHQLVPARAALEGLHLAD